MLDTIFQGVFDSALTSVISVADFMLCLGLSLLLGLVMAFAYMYRTRYTKSFVVTLALLPAVVCVVIMLVNGNVGTGVAVAGAFSLVRFRSVPGTAKEICTLFLAMGAGLIAGMGYLGFAVLFTVVMCVMFLLYNRLDLGARKNAAIYKTLAVTIPEDLDYTDVFEDVFQFQRSASSSPTLPSLSVRCTSITRWLSEPMNLASHVRRACMNGPSTNVSSCSSSSFAPSTLPASKSSHR